MKPITIHLHSPLKTLLKEKAAATVFARRHLGCFTCKGMEQETLLNACVFHGLDPERLIGEIEEERAGKAKKR